MKANIVQWSSLLEPSNPWSAHQSLRPEARHTSANFVGVGGENDHVNALEWEYVEDVASTASSSTAMVAV
eukprot:1791741-Prorocentrum_lima.AAC.1